jgi:NAD(P)-dependent dehydrogenase (short-subunit alcohol dehydrogenase family)
MADGGHHLDMNIMAEDLPDEIFINLFSNTVKYTDSSEIKIDVTIKDYFNWQSAVDADLDTVNQAIRTNLFGPWRLSQICIPIMKRNKYGRIVNVSSGAGSIHYMTGGTPSL